MMGASSAQLRFVGVAVGIACSLQLQLCSHGACVHAMDNGLARTPPMGWSSWNAYGGHQSYAEMVSTGDELVNKGLAALGYVNVDMDGGWYRFTKAPDPSGAIHAPWDMRNLSDHLHAQGLKMGMYVTGGMAGVYKHEDTWAKVMFEDWNADSVKVDHMCGDTCESAPGAINHHSDQIVPAFQQETVERWSAAIAKTGKKVLFNNCGVGCSPSEGWDSRDPRPWGEWCRETANTWRSSGDASVQSWHNNLESLIGRGSYSQPGGWNYPDSLEIGNTHKGYSMQAPEARAHFSLWCITSSPLMLGTNMTKINATDLAIVSNKDAIRVNQAWAGYAGDMLNFSSPAVLPVNVSRSNYSRLPTNSVWWKPLPNNSAAAVLYASRGDALISFALSELTWRGEAALPSAEGCSVKSVWANDALGGGGRAGAPGSPIVGGRFSAHVPAGDVVFIVISGCSSLTPTGKQ